MKNALNMNDHLSAVKIVGVYAIVAALWIYFMDNIFDSIILDSAFFVNSSVLKILLFLIVTSALLYRLIIQHLEKSKHIEEKLRVDLNLINIALKGTTDVIYIKDRDGRYRLFNSAAGQVTGKTAEEVIGKDDTNIFQDEQAMCVMEHDRQVMNAGCVITYEEILTTNDGTVRTFLSTKGPINDENGELYGLFGISRDITRRKQAEKMLLDSEERYRRLFEVESDAVLLVDCETEQIIDANEAALKLYGYTKFEFLLLKDADVSAEPDKTRQAIATRQTRIPLRWHRKKDGTIFPVEIAASYFEYQGHKINVAAIRDITERKELQNRLNAIMLEQSVILENASVGISLVKDRRQMWANRKLSEIFGYPIAAMAGQSTQMFFASCGDHEKLGQEAYPIIAHGDIYSTELELKRSDGTIFWGKVRGKAINTSDPLAGSIWIIEDITERKRIEAALVESEIKYRELVESLHEGVWMIDSDEITVFVNSRMAEMLGYTVDEMFGKSIISFIDRFSWETAERYFRRHQWGIKERRRLDFRGKNGTILHTSVSTSARIDSNGKYAGAIVGVIDTTEQLQLEQKIQQISITERQRLGRDLHDDLGQHLTGIAFMSKVLAQKLTLKLSEEATDAGTVLTLINEAINKTRSLARGLCPVGPGTENIISGLKALATKAETMYGISCTLDVDNTIRIKDNNKSMQLCYIAKEAINNAIRHGRAKKISISLTAADDKISLTISDDGVGLPKQLSFDKGLGLDIMMYRVGIMNGLLNIHGGSSGGTVISCTFRESARGAGSIDQ